MTADGLAGDERRKVLVTLKLAMEVGRDRVAALMRNLLRGLIGLGECAGDAQFVETLRCGAVCGVAERAREAVGLARARTFFAPPLWKVVQRAQEGL